VAGRGLVILNQPLRLVEVIEMKLKKEIPKDTSELAVLVLWVMPVQVCEASSLPPEDNTRL
jgi:hypothetical protein